jgi:hypothetical protein
MRMPIVSYFIVVGSALVGLLLWVGDAAVPTDTAVKTSQTVGLPKPFKAPRDTSQLRPTGANFAAERESPPVAKPAKTVEAPRKPKVLARHPPRMPAWNQLAEYPYDRLSVH